MARLLDILLPQVVSTLVSASLLVGHAELTLLPLVLWNTRRQVSIWYFPGVLPFIDGSTDVRGAPEAKSLFGTSRGWCP